MNISTGSPRNDGKIIYQGTCIICHGFQLNHTDQHAGDMGWYFHSATVCPSNYYLLMRRGHLLQVLETAPSGKVPQDG